MWCCVVNSVVDVHTVLQFQVLVPMYDITVAVWLQNTCRSNCLVCTVSGQSLVLRLSLGLSGLRLRRLCHELVVVVHVVMAMES